MWTQFLSLVSREEHGGGGMAGMEPHRTAGSRHRPMSTPPALLGALDKHIASQSPEHDSQCEHWPRGLGTGSGRTWSGRAGVFASTGGLLPADAHLWVLTDTQLST